MIGDWFGNMAENQAAPGPRWPLTPAEIHLEALATAALVARDPAPLRPVLAEIEQLEAQIHAYRARIDEVVDGIRNDLLRKVFGLDAPAHDAARERAAGRLRELYADSIDIGRAQARGAELNQLVRAAGAAADQADAAFLRAPRAAQRPVAIVGLPYGAVLNGVVSFFPPGGACAQLLPTMLKAEQARRSNRPHVAHPDWVLSAYLSADGTKLLEAGPADDHIHTPSAIVIGRERLPEVVDALAPP
jgi:hypothetical protein